jgi:hypothetical protein
MDPVVSPYEKVMKELAVMLVDDQIDELIANKIDPSAAHTSFVVYETVMDSAREFLLQDLQEQVSLYINERWK